MSEVSIVGVDLAKQVLQVHGAAADGQVLFRKKLSRAQFAEVHGVAAALCGGDGGMRNGALLGS